ncbi:MAG: UvrD-helicase domain-containing protein [Treponema sp.]|nr:UvrD-helicase domain-containing protein [Treponema sp.]
MTIENLPFIQGLDDEQRAAVITEEDTVVSAGAGSGKTRVLSARYGYLIMSGRCEVDQILTITFTNKAANEMYRRIYSLLSEHASGNEYARKAVESFHKAWISTLDSFCLGVARNVCRRFGISPGFESNDMRVKEEACSLALRFVLDKRNDPALQRLIAEKNIRQTADELFVRSVLFNSTVSSPLDFNRFEKIQREEICKQWRIYANASDEQIALIKEKYGELPETLKLREYLSAVLPDTKNAPEIKPLFADTEDPETLRNEIVLFLQFIFKLKNCKLNVGKNETALIIKEAVFKLRESCELLHALASQAFQWDIVKQVFPLIEEYQELLNQKKREAGILTFSDIAHLAVDGLRQHEDIRQMYRNSFRMIMIDEFQDNNSLQRDLVDLLAGPAKVFYVGDEKQSIYRFRGADVSVFRSLVQNTGHALRLNRNYRSEPVLISAFNLIFGGYRNKDDNEPEPAVFPPDGTKTESYQATYRWIKSRDTGGSNKPQLHFAFFDTGRRDKEDSLKAEDHEAYYIAAEINNLITQKTIVYDKECAEERACDYGDFAVLLRSYTHQHSLERAFKQYGIPFNADRPASLFNEAPVNDLWAWLKLLVYPGDRIAYGALLRSPFVRLSEDAFTVCMLSGGKPFDESLDELLPPPDRFRYQQARNCYRKLQVDARDCSVSSLITKLWYEEGYRNEVLWSASTQVYLDLYDLFFEKARVTEEQGGSLVDFLDYLESLANKKEKPDDSILSGEESSGVRIMTIHRSKGLEFPIVFVYNCGNAEKVNLNRGLALYSDRWGVFLKLPRPEELSEAYSASGECDYFYLSEKSEHRDKTEAELRRLLYVAMTRAEQKLYVTAVIPAQNKAEREELNYEDRDGYGKEYIIERLEQYRRNPNIESMSFLRLLPALNGSNPLYTIEAIDCQKHIEQPKKAAELSIEEAARKAALDYETIPVVSPYCHIPQIIYASSLHTQPFSESPAFSGRIDELLQQTGIPAQEFGTIVHSFIEAIFNEEEPKLHSRFSESLGITNRKALTETALALADGFFNSPLGRKAVSAGFRKTEYPVLTAVQCRQHKYIVSGKIDLLFDNGSSVYVVDFKTDKDEDITRHIGQLAVYKRAAEDIFGKPAECRLFYLRTGHEADLNEEISKTSPEELVAEWNCQYDT